MGNIVVMAFNISGGPGRNYFSGRISPSDQAPLNPLELVYFSRQIS